MSDKISGAFPGGPSRADKTPQRAGPIRTARVEELEEARTRRSVNRRRRDRRRRVIIGFVVSCLVAGGVGLALGLGSHQTAQDLSTQAQEARTRDLDISQEVNRTLLELWRMEEAELRRGPGRPR